MGKTLREVPMLRTKSPQISFYGSYTQSYDANGNMTGRANVTGTQTLTWNVENLLSQVQGNGGGYSRSTG